MDTKSGNSRFNFQETGIAGLYSIMRKPIGDSRGFFSRFFCAGDFQEIGLTRSIVQMNHSLTQRKGVVRGMHFQHPPYTETKIITCIRGEVFDVAVDIRIGSPTFLQWHGEVLSAQNQTSLYIPDGFAHGFQTLTDDSELLYLHTAFYQPDAEDALNAQDPRISINWPLEVAEMSERDHSHPMIDSKFKGVLVQ